MVTVRVVFRLKPPLKCLSRMSGNYHVRFLGGKGAEKPLTYPVVGAKKIIINFILLTIVRHWRIFKIWK
jgi:hypothetical protein